jgi:3-phytase
MDDGRSAVPSAVALVPEAFVTAFDSTDNIDSPAVYHSPDSGSWIIATAKTTNVLVVYDAATGAVLRRVGGTGAASGQLLRPNGIAVVDDSLLLVVERDNHRVQGFHLPSFRPLGAFAADLLRLPYGITWYREEPGVHIVYVTDNYEMPDESVPPDRELGARVKQFRVRFRGDSLHAEHIRSFGDTTGAGAIRIAESIAVDPERGRLLIAEELESDSHVKVYTLDGQFTGEVFGRGYFPQQAEGLALFRCGDSTGYWVTTDQGDSTNTFHLFDRISLKHLGSFTGSVTRRTDGIALTQRAFGPFREGALYGSHLDAAIGAFSWSDIAAALGLTGCNSTG